MIFRDAFSVKRDTLFFAHTKIGDSFGIRQNSADFFWRFFSSGIRGKCLQGPRVPFCGIRAKPRRRGFRKRKHAEKLRIFEKNAIFPVQNEAVHEENDTYHAGRDGIRSRRIGTGDRPRRARPRIPDRGLARRPAAGGRTAHLHRVFPLVVAGGRQVARAAARSLPARG